MKKAIAWTIFIIGSVLFPLNWVIALAMLDDWLKDTLAEDVK